MEKDSRDIILSLLAEKAVTKQSVIDHSHNGFQQVRNTLKKLADELRPKLTSINATLAVDYSVKGELEVEFSLAGDTIVFLLHSNVFTFDNSHEIWKTSYIKEDASRAYCGQIFVYNFLSDSMKYFRGNDV